MEDLHLTQLIFDTKLSLTPCLTKNLMKRGHELQSPSYEYLTQFTVSNTTDGIETRKTS
jgi:hypothetical protein